MSEYFENWFGRFREFELDYDHRVLIAHVPCQSNSGEVSNLLEALQWAVQHECDRGIK